MKYLLIWVMALMAGGVMIGCDHDVHEPGSNGYQLQPTSQMQAAPAQASAAS